MSVTSAPQVSDLANVHLFRHGEVHNPEGVLYGRLPDFHLSELGQEMATVTSAWLTQRNLTHLRCSPLERAQETMAPLAAATGMTVTTDERVIEAGNILEGSKVTSDVKTLLHPKWWWHLRNPFRPSWGEAHAEIAVRMAAAIEDARSSALNPAARTSSASEKPPEAVIVSHQLPIWIARMHAENKRLWHDPRSRQCTLASVTTLHFQGKHLKGVTYCEPAAALLPEK